MFWHSRGTHHFEIRKEKEIEKSQTVSVSLCSPSELNRVFRLKFQI